MNDDELNVLLQEATALIEADRIVVKTVVEGQLDELPCRIPR